MVAPKPGRQLGTVPEVRPLKDVNPPVIVTGEAAARDGLASIATVAISNNGVASVKRTLRL
jgi:hypothetical protein